MEKNSMQRPVDRALTELFQAVDREPDFDRAVERMMDGLPGLVTLASQLAMQDGMKAEHGRQHAELVNTMNARAREAAQILQHKAHVQQRRRARNESSEQRSAEHPPARMSGDAEKDEADDRQ